MAEFAVAADDSIRAEPDCFTIAARFRYYAFQCRARAARALSSEQKVTLNRRADQFEQDAQRVIIAAQSITTSKAVLERVSALHPSAGQSAASVGGLFRGLADGVENCSGPFG